MIIMVIIFTLFILLLTTIFEITRLKKGNFTDDELQNLCHNMTNSDRECFQKGCIKYQRKLFGPIRYKYITKEDLVGFDRRELEELCYEILHWLEDETFNGDENVRE